MTISKEGTPLAIGTPEYVYDYVLQLLSKHNAHKILDCPAGNGAFTARLLNNNFKVGACDINNNLFKLKETVECRYADMNDRLPYEDNSFEAAVCLNGMHRVWARGRIISEFSRILVDNGLLIITNVNNVNLLHRMTYLACGSANFNTIGPPHGFLPNAEIPAAWFRSPLTIADVVNIGSSAGLSVEGIDSISTSWKSVYLSPIALMVWGLSLFLPKRFHKHCFIKEANGLSGLFSDYVAIVLRKSI